MLQYRERGVRQLAAWPVSAVESQVDGAEELSELPGLVCVAAHQPRLAARLCIVNPDGLPLSVISSGDAGLVMGTASLRNLRASTWDGRHPNVRARVESSAPALDRHRRQALAILVDGLADRGALAAGLSRQRAVDRAWMLTGVEIYLAATDGCGWSDADYATWLADLLVSQLLTSGHALG